MSLNLGQIFVRFPDPVEAAEFLSARLPPKSPGWVVARAGGPWLAVGAADDSPPPEVAQTLSRGLEAEALWYGLAASTLAYRLIRFSLGREAEQILEPAEIFGPDAAFPLPAYRDVETVLYGRLRDAGLPPSHVYLHFSEIGMKGGDAKKPDAAMIRDGGVRAFAHRVPKRPDGVRPLYDEYREEEKLVCERLLLRGGFDESRARQLLATLETIRRRRPLPEGWRVRYVTSAPRDPDLIPRLAAVHAKGAYGYELAAT